MRERVRKEVGGRHPASVSLDDLGEAVVTVDEAGRITYANAACAGTIGWLPDDLVGMDLVRLVPERFRLSHLRAFRRFLDTGQGRLIGHPVVLPVLRPDGDEVLTELVISAVPSVPPVLIGAFRAAARPHASLPEERLAQGLLIGLAEGHEGRDLVRRLLAAVGEALAWPVVTLWTVQRSTDQLRCEEFWAGINAGRFEAASRGALLPRGVDLPGRAWEGGGAVWAEHLGDDPGFVRLRAAAAVGLHSGVAFPLWASGRFVGVIECFDRTVKRLDREMVALAGGVGSVLGRLLDRGQIEEERRGLFDQVHTERARLRAVLRQLPQGVIITDANGKVVLANDAVHQLIGPAAKDGTYRLRQLEGDEVQGAASLADGTVLTDEEVQLRGARGSLVSLSVSAVPVRDQQGQLVSTVTTLVDVTERRAEQARIELLARAGDILSRSLEIDETLAAIADISVPALGDLCAIDLVDLRGRLRRVAAAAVDSASEGVLRRIRHFYEIGDERGGEAWVLVNGQPSIRGTSGPGNAAESEDDFGGARHGVPLRSLGLRSLVIVPLVGRGPTLGTLTFGTLASTRAIPATDVDLMVELGRRVGLAVVNAQLYEGARHVSDTLQASLLPPALPTIPGLEVGACFIPGGDGLIVGGDFYDVYQVDEGRWAVMIGDVCGKGAAAAAVTARVRYTARAVPERDDPRALLSLLNALLRAEEGEPRFCTVVHAVLTLDAGSVGAQIGSGGHPPPIVVRADGTTSVVSARGPLLGVLDEVIHDPVEVNLEREDALVLFTDGVTEARGSGGFFGEERLRTLLAGTAGRSAADIAHVVQAAVTAHTEGRITDDVAVLVVRVGPQGRR